MANKDPRPSSSRRCPICGEMTEPAYRPFCSARCRDVDLARWLSGGYAIVGTEAADEDGDEAAAPRAGGEAPRGGEDDVD